MEKNIWKDLGYWVQKKAHEAGASDSEINIAHSRQVEVDYRDGRVEKMKESGQQSLSLEIYANGRYSSHSTNDLRRDSLEKFIENAVALTAFLEEDEFRTLPDPELYRGQPQVDLDLRDPGYEELTTEKRKERAAEIGGYLEGRDERIISVASGFSDYHGQSYKLKSNGFEGSRETTYYSQYSDVSLQGEGDRKPNGWRSFATRHLVDMPSTRQTALEGLQRTRDQLGQQKVATATLPMLVENSNAAGLFWRLMYPLSGSAIQQKNSFLDGMQDQQVASTKLTLRDDPAIVRGLGSRYYDGDGIAARTFTLIEAGKLRNYYVDNYYAHKLGWKPTTGGSSNLVIQPGQRSLSELEKDVQKGILVTQWLGGNANSTTGDFSLGVAGWLIEKGERTLPVSEMNISGNYRELLLNLVEVGNDPYPYSSFRTPSLLFEGVKFSGS